MGTVSGLALLAGGTAVAAVAGGTHSVFATVLLGMLAVGMGHALLTEIQRQARRRGVGGWASQDTVNTVLLASWSGGALTATLMAVAPDSVRAVGLLLSLAYALSCAYFVLERYRTISVTPSPLEPAPSHSSGSATIIGGIGTTPLNPGSTSGRGTQSSPTGSGPPTWGPSSGSPSATVHTNTEVIPEGYGKSWR